MQPCPAREYRKGVLCLLWNRENNPEGEISYAQCYAPANPRRNNLFVYFFLLLRVVVHSSSSEFFSLLLLLEGSVFPKNLLKLYQNNSLNETAYQRGWTVVDPYINR